MLKNQLCTIFLVLCILLNGCGDRDNPMMDAVIPAIVEEPVVEEPVVEEPVVEEPVVEEPVVEEPSISLDIPDVTALPPPQRTHEKYLELRPEDLPLYTSAEEALAADHTVEYLDGLQEWLSTVCLEHNDKTVHTYKPLRIYFTIDYSDFTNSEREKFISFFQEPQGFWKIETGGSGRKDIDSGLTYIFELVNLSPSPFLCN